MSVANQLPAAMTVAEFLNWNAQDSDRWELIDGTPQAMAPASPVVAQSRARQGG